MDLTQKQNEVIKKLQKLILTNIVTCSDKTRKNAINQFKNVKFEIMSEIDLTEMGESASVAAFFDESKNSITINSMYLDSLYFEHLLLHEMFHAYSFNNNKTGFYFIENVQYDKNFFNRCHNCTFVTKKFEMLNESATEFYATMFSDKKMVSYTFLLPIYGNLSEVCGFDKLLNLYFSNNTIAMLNLVKKSFHLKNDYLVNKLFMQMDQSFNIKTGLFNKSYIPYVYRTLIDMHIEKLNVEIGRKLSNSELCQLIDIDKIIKSAGLLRYDDINEFNIIENNLKNYIKNYNDPKKTIDFDELKFKMDNFICDRLLGNKTANYCEYKKYFSEHLLDCILYLGQSNICKIDSYRLNSDLQINEFLNFMHDKNKHIDLSNLSEGDKDLFIKIILENKKHNIINPEKHFYDYDLISVSANK